MKRIYSNLSTAAPYIAAFIIMVLMAFSLSACASGNRNTNENATEDTRENANENFDENINDNRTEVMERIVKNNVYLEEQNVGGLKESEVLEIIRNYAVKFDSEPGLTLAESKNDQINQGTTAEKVNIGMTLESVLNARENERVGIVMESVSPKANPSPKKDSNKPKSGKTKLKLIGGSTTTLLNRTEPRVNNIDIASEKINNKVVAPGEEFSFNAVVGRRTEAKGYEEAPIIIKTESGPKEDHGIGGGICQISTTLYNAVEKANLKVTERHIHSKDVGYVEKGDDATVSYGTADFKFVNTRENPVVIKIFRGKKSLTVKLYEKGG